MCALINEEPAIRTQMRLINAHTGMTFDEIRADMDKTKEKWAEVEQNINILSKESIDACLTQNWL